MNNGISLHRISCLEELLSTLELILLFLPTDLFCLVQPDITYFWVFFGIKHQKGPNITFQIYASLLEVRWEVYAMKLELPYFFPFLLVFPNSSTLCLRHRILERGRPGRFTETWLSYWHENTKANNLNNASGDEEEELQGGT